MQAEIQSLIRDIPNFPKDGILFKDITPLLKNPEACSKVVDFFVEKYSSPGTIIDAVVGIESRGFFLGPTIAMRLGVPFIPVRKSGKLPYHTIKQCYGLEYGEDCIEMHIDAIGAGYKVLIHDDILATGGTARACADLVYKAGGEVIGYAFLAELDFLEGRKKLPTQARVETLLNYTE